MMPEDFEDWWFAKCPQFDPITTSHVLAAWQAAKERYAPKFVEMGEQIEADTALLNQIFNDLRVKRTEGNGFTPAFGSVSLSTFGKLMRRVEGGSE